MAAHGRAEHKKKREKAVWVPVGANKAAQKKKPTSKTFEDSNFAEGNGAGVAGGEGVLGVQRAETQRRAAHPEFADQARSQNDAEQRQNGASDSVQRHAQAAQARARLRVLARHPRSELPKRFQTLHALSHLNAMSIRI